MSVRRAIFYFFVGENGTGKTTAMKAFLKANKRNLVFPSSEIDKAWSKFPKIKPEKFVIDDPKSPPGKKRQKYVYRIPGLNTFQDTRVVDLSDIPDDDALIDLFYSVIAGPHRFRKGGLFIDDFKNYVKSAGLLPYPVKKLMTGYRHYEQDLFFATHSFGEVNGQFLGHNPVFYIFKSDRHPSHAFVKNYAKADELQAVYKHVQKMAKNNRFYCAKFPQNSTHEDD